jgi:hypothetical protein
MSGVIQTTGIFVATSLPAPAVTLAPELFRRQDVQDPETCGFWSFSDRETSTMALTLATRLTMDN